MKHIIATFLMRSCFSQARSIGFHSIARARTRSCPTRLPSTLWPCRLFNRCDNNALSASNSRHKRYYGKAGSQASLSVGSDSYQPSWLDVGPGSKVTLEGSVTEIDVPGSGKFPLYGVAYCYEYQYADFHAALIFGLGIMLTTATQILSLTFDTCRDNCPCEKCTHPQTHQRQHNSFDVR